MWKTITAIFRGRAARAEQTLETENAALILEQKIREADAGHASAKRALAALIARSKTDRMALEALNKRAEDLEVRTRQAVSQGKAGLAEDAANLLADLENERAVRTNALTKAEEKADRLRLAIEKTDRRLIDLRQGLITAKSIEAERGAMRNLKGSLSANSAISEGEGVLKRLVESDDPVAEVEALEEIEQGLSGEAVFDRLADAGIGSATKIRAQDILSRISDELAAGPPAPQSS